MLLCNSARLSPQVGILVVCQHVARLSNILDPVLLLTRHVEHQACSCCHLKIALWLSQLEDWAQQY